MYNKPTVTVSYLIKITVYLERAMYEN
jgi:hypothetical protein